MTTYTNSAGQLQESPDTTVTWTASDGSLQDGLPDAGPFTNAAGQLMEGADRESDYVNTADQLMGAASPFRSPPFVVYPININPFTGPAGTRFLFALGITNGNPNPTPTYSLTFNGVEVELDEGGGYTPTEAGELVWSAVWTNGVDPDAYESVSADVT